MDEVEHDVAYDERRAARNGGPLSLTAKPIVSAFADVVALAHATICIKREAPRTNVSAMPFVTDINHRTIVSVLMLKEGWDVKNVTTIVGLRSYQAKSNILPEQTLGRGLRCRCRGGNVAETVSVIALATRENRTFAISS